MVRLQIEMGAQGIWRRGDAARPIRSHLETRCGEFIDLFTIRNTKLWGKNVPPTLF